MNKAPNLLIEVWGFCFTRYPEFFLRAMIDASPFLHYPGSQNMKKNLLNLLTILLCTLVLVEGALRVAPYIIKDPLKSVMIEASRIPLSNVRVFGGLKGGVKILLPTQSSADYLVVGASMPFGTYERAEDTFASKLGELENSSVVNLSVGSTGLAHFNRMIEVGSRYRPSNILYCLSVNDFIRMKDSPRQLAADNTHQNRTEDVDLFYDRLPVSEQVINSMKRVTNLSLIYQLRKLLMQPVQKNSAIQWSDATRFFVFSPRNLWDIKLSWNDPNVRVAAEQAVDYVSSAVDYSQKIGAKLSVVLIPSKEMVYAPVVGRDASAFYDESYHESFKQLAYRLEEKHTPVLDLTNSLRTKALAGEKLYHSIDGHLNPSGHLAAAEAIQAFLKRGKL